VGTDAEGRFVLESLPPGAYTLQSNHGCEHRQHADLQPVTVELAAGESREGIVLSFLWGSSVQGAVRTPTGVAAPEGAQVWLVRESRETGERAHSVGVDQGRYELSGVPAGRYRICAHRSEAWSRDHECAEGLPVTLGDDPLTVDLVLR
jgi:hypothetical protein